MPVLDPQGLINNRVEAIRKFHSEVGTDKAELDLSGGIDSAVMAGLLIRALGEDNVTLVYSSINSDPASAARAREVALTFNGRFVELNLTAAYNALVQEMTRGLIESSGVRGTPAVPYLKLRQRCEADRTVMGSIRSCLRAPVGRGINRMVGGGIRHGTGNECEDRWLRFFQKGGDGEVDTNPIAMLSKGEVYQLALALGVPKSVITCKPTPDLWGNGEYHNDEDEIGQYLGINAAEHGFTFYSYIDPDTGKYTSVGLIERVSRFLDKELSLQGGRPTRNDKRLFSEMPIESWFDVMIRHDRAVFGDVPDSLVGPLLLASRRVEKRTRHKWNPNIPMLGDRAGLVAAGILTDILPTNTHSAPEGAVDCSLFTRPVTG